MLARAHCLVVVSFAACGSALAQGIVGTGFFPGGDHTELIGLSADGRIGAGAAVHTDGLGHAYWWSPGVALHDIGLGAADAVSGDGSVVVGFDFVGLAFRWTAAGGAQSLGALPGKNWSAARGVSANGSVVVGGSSGATGSETNAIGRAFRWTAAGGMLDLGTLPDRNSSGAAGVSGDGAVVVGFCCNTPPQGASSQYKAFRWTAGGGMQDLGTLEGDARAAAASGDGSVIVGSSDLSGGATHAFRWTAGGGMQDLGVAAGQAYSTAAAVSADGSVVVGSGSIAGQGRAVLWTPALGMVDLNTYLPSVGVPLGPWVLSSAEAVSADGRTIAGIGKRSDNWEGWLVTLPGPCYANCDGSTVSPVLNILDFACFLNRFAAGDPYANCDGSTTPPVLNVLDFGCFLNRFAAGCW